MSEYAHPHELNGTLVATLLPLTCNGLRSLDSPPVRVKSNDSDADPFLAARATLQAPRKLRIWGPMRDTTQFHSWPAPVLLAHTAAKTSTRDVVFGRSGSIVADAQDDAQPLRLPESSAASLWLVPGTGLVLALERLAADVVLAEQCDKIGRLLMTTTDVVTDRPFPIDTQALVLDLGLLMTEGGGATSGRVRLSPPAPTPPAPSAPAPAVHQLMKEMGFEADDSLESLFGDQVADLDALVDRTTAVVDLLVPRRTMLAGDRLLEGLVIGLAAADDSAKLGVADVLGRRADDGDDEDEEWQQLGYRWAYDEMSLVTDPARADARCALRSDARVAVVDIDAMSYRHDYLDYGGSDVVRGLLPLAAVLGQIAGDHSKVVDALSRLAATGGKDLESDLDDDKVLQRDLRLAREVRTRLELRRLQQPQLLNGPNYRKWTEGGELRRVMAPGTLVDELDIQHVGDDNNPMDVLDASVHALEGALSRRSDELRVRTERSEALERELANQQAEKNRRLVEWALGLVSAAGVIGLFASLASMPDADRELRTLPAAGLWTLVSLAILMGLGVLGYTAMKQKPLDHARPVAVALLLLGGLTSAWGLRTPQDGQWLPLVLSGVLMLAAAAVGLLGIDPDAPPSSTTATSR